MFKRPRTGERAVLVHLTLGNGEETRELGEFKELAASAGAQCVSLITGTRQAPDPHFFIGSGKAREVHDTLIREQAELVIFDHDLSPSQERNLEAFLQCRVLSRTGLILDIFAQRARSFEGKLQVELAQLHHMATRLVRGWTHLERQKGGIGLRGPGETQLETDRRLLNERIKQINRRLKKVDRQRDQGRRSRRKADVVTVSLVGYTNAGKSTLFNRMTDARVYVADQLFATLDPTIRGLELADSHSVVLADTVGFIRHLPHELVAAFRSTLQETCEADLLLHVIDASDPKRRDYMEQVEHVLQHIGAADIPRLLVYNKIDLLGEHPRIMGDDQTAAVWVSAANGAGMDLLLAAIAERVAGDTVHGWVRLPPEAGRLRARLFSLGAVLQESLNADGGWSIRVRTSRKNLAQLSQQENLNQKWFQSVA